MVTSDTYVEAGSLVVLSGLPGAGKSSLKARASGFRDLDAAWISTDALREQLLGASAELEAGARVERLAQSANAAVFSIAREMVRTRLAHGLTCIVDATNPTDADRRGWVELAQAAGVPAKVLILDTPLQACLQANAQRARRVPESSLRAMHGSADGTTRFALTSQFAHEVVSREARLVLRRPMLEHERYDVVGDVHGLRDELLALLARAGWTHENGRLTHPGGRKLLFLGDLVDRGPDSVGVVRLVRQAVLDGVACALKGNHELKLVRFLQMARTEGVERWSSFANAETGMQFLKMADGEALAQFLHTLPAYRLFEADGERLAFVHADMHRFDAELTPAPDMVLGQTRRERGVDVDERYEAGWAAGLNTWTLVRGHIPQTSVQPHVFSLERHAFQKGELMLLRLDGFLAARRAGLAPAQAFGANVLTQRSQFDFAAYSERWALARGLDALVKERLVTAQTDATKLFRVYKYSKRTFWENRWDASPWLAKARGLVLDPAGAIVSHPFEKCFNYLENGAGSELAEDAPLVAVEKLNGFLGIVSAHPLERNALLVHTQGSFEGEFVRFIHDYLSASVAGRVKKYLATHDVTLLFEVIHPEDPHIIEYAAGDHGLWLVGVRDRAPDALPWPEEAVDEAAEVLGLRRPTWFRTTKTQLLARCRAEDAALAKTEGWMARADAPGQVHLFKLKTPYYLTTKFLGRLSDGRIEHLYANPGQFKQTLDEEFYPLVDALAASCTKEALKSMGDAERVSLVRQLLKTLPVSAADANASRPSC
jgi:predicted kinase